MNEWIHLKYMSCNLLGMEFSAGIIFSLPTLTVSHRGPWEWVLITISMRGFIGAMTLTSIGWTSVWQRHFKPTKVA